MITSSTVDAIQQQCTKFAEIDYFDSNTKPSWFQATARRKLLRWLESVQHGAVRFSDSISTEKYGDESSALQADMNVADPRFYRRLALGGSLGVAESYLREEWHTKDLTKLLRVMCRNLSQVHSANNGFAKLVESAFSLLNKYDSNTVSGSKKHIAAHYDLSNEFFELFLDPTMMYSSAYFENDQTTLHEASVAKLEKICQKLQLRSTDSLLEIGTGWGGFALHAVQNYGCEISTTTISDAQYSKAEQRFKEAGIEHKAKLLKLDYRNLSGQYDKIVSLEMIEAVGKEYLDSYFQQCGKLLKPGGRLVLQAIIMPESRYESYSRGTDFIRQYIFPGGFLPSFSAMQEAVGRNTNLCLDGLEDISSHYADTLRHWRNNFFANIDRVRQLGFDNRFIRMWEYYLCYCEAAFQEQAVRVVQIVWDKPTH